MRVHLNGWPLPFSYAVIDHLVAPNLRVFYVGPPFELACLCFQYHKSLNCHFQASFRSQCDFGKYICRKISIYGKGPNFWQASLNFWQAGLDIHRECRLNFGQVGKQSGALSAGAKAGANRTSNYQLLKILVKTTILDPLLGCSTA